MMTPYPHDIIGHWIGAHNVELTSEAYDELVELFITYANHD